jgi:hypothetical protein
MRINARLLRRIRRLARSNFCWRRDKAILGTCYNREAERYGNEKTGLVDPVSLNRACSGGLHLAGSLRSKTLGRLENGFKLKFSDQPRTRLRTRIE